MGRYWTKSAPYMVGYTYILKNPWKWKMKKTKGVGTAELGDKGHGDLVTSMCMNTCQVEARQIHFIITSAGHVLFSLLQMRNPEISPFYRLRN